MCFNTGEMYHEPDRPERPELKASEAPVKKYIEVTPDVLMELYAEGTPIDDVGYTLSDILSIEFKAKALATMPMLPRHSIVDLRYSRGFWDGVALCREVVEEL